MRVFSVLLLLTASGCFVDKAAQVADRVTDPDKMIHDYEWFHSASTAIDSRVAQISATRTSLADVTIVGAERTRIRTDLAGQQQSCRDLVADYNGNAAKVTFGAFKGWSLPDRIDPSRCE